MFFCVGARERALQAQNLHFHCGFVGVAGFTVPGMKKLRAFSEGKMKVFWVRILVNGGLGTIAFINGFDPSFQKGTGTHV